MALSCISDYHAQNEASSLPKHSASFASTLSNELHPIRIGMVVQQPQPDPGDVTFLGLAWLLPEDLRPLCSCAGLFFSRMNDCGESDEQVELEIAAFPHYFDSDDDTYFWHVRTLILSKATSAQLLAYDRRLAAMATCDLRELLEEHTAQAAAVLGSHPAVKGLQEEGPAAPDSDEEEADLAPLSTIFVPRVTIRESLETLEVTSARDRRVQTVLLHAVLDTISLQIKYCRSRQGQRLLQWQYDQVCAVQQWRRLRHDRGHGWQRVVTLEPAWEGGQAGWDLIVGVPLSLAA